MLGPHPWVWSPSQASQVSRIPSIQVCSTSDKVGWRSFLCGCNHGYLLHLANEALCILVTSIRVQATYIPAWLRAWLSNVLCVFVFKEGLYMYTCLICNALSNLWRTNMSMVIWLSSKDSMGSVQCLQNDNACDLQGMSVRTSWARCFVQEMTRCSSCSSFCLVSCSKSLNHNFKIAVWHFEAVRLWVVNMSYTHLMIQNQGR